MVRAEVRRFQRAAEEVASTLKSQLVGETRAKIITHTDPDGITAGNILANCLNYYDIPFHITFTSPLSDSEIKELSEEDYELYFFLDQGTGQISGIEKYLLEEDYKVVILDHHPGDFPDYSELTHLNPHTYDLNGAKDVSAAGVVYSVIKELDKKFSPLSEVAVIGALGDRQEFFSGFTGVNQEIVKQAIDDGVLEARKGLKLVPRNSKIVECLTLSMKPYLPGVSGDEEAARELVESLEIDPDQILSELDLNEEKNLRDEILERVNIDPNESFKHALWGMMYTVSTIKQSTGPENSHEYVTMLDACEKLGEPEVGFSALFGDGEMRSKAIEMLQEYQNKTVDILSQFVSEKRNFKSTSNMKYIYTKDEVEPNMIGETLSLAIEAGLIIPDLPTLIMANSNEDKMKVSARAQPEYAMKGPNIGTILGKVSQELGGSGGGHDVAAAARFPRKRKDEFIARVDNYLKEALNEN